MLPLCGEIKIIIEYIFNSVVEPGRTAALDARPDAVLYSRTGATGTAVQQRNFTQSSRPRYSSSSLQHALRVALISQSSRFSKDVMQSLWRSVPAVTFTTVDSTSVAFPPKFGVYNWLIAQVV